MDFVPFLLLARPTKMIKLLPKLKQFIAQNGDNFEKEKCVKIKFINKLQLALRIFPYYI